MLPGLALVTLVMSPPPFSSLDRTAGESGAGADIAVQQLDDSNTTAASSTMATPPGSIFTESTP